jgi:hypothetical protein
MPNNNPFATLVSSMTKSIVSRVHSMQSQAVSSLIQRMDQIDQNIASKADLALVQQGFEGIRGLIGENGLIGTNGLELSESDVDALVDAAFSVVAIGPQPLPPGSDSGLIGENGLTNGLIGENGLEETVVIGTK